ncbi:VOC family protein [Ochrobactrum sp. SFR4]|uniref:VOC family protein n=1 Tax=Ochrobactrum sp. SFR4 TaxID=2717368 RepID=UPI001C8B1FCB|nr:VOC family protein [Ochrobactrum sp. SFR4]MBX8824781.1 lactoylglutathione lyase [Ochrobactrum sp. SFR4]
MSRLIFVNFPVRDLDKSISFYEAIGARKNDMFCDETAACMVLSDVIHVMLITHDKFRQFTPKNIADAHTVSEVLVCVSASDKQEVDQLVSKAASVGGKADPSAVQDYGFMYGRSFEDLDGHIWEVMWMDMEAAKQAMAKD